MAIDYVNKAGLTEFYKKIKDKIPAAVSSLTNDSGYVTAEELSGKGYQTASDVQAAITAALASYGDGNTEAF